MKRNVIEEQLPDFFVGPGQVGRGAGVELGHLEPVNGHDPPTVLTLSFVFHLKKNSHSNERREAAALDH